MTLLSQLRVLRKTVAAAALATIGVCAPQAAMAEEHQPEPMTELAGAISDASMSAASPAEVNSASRQQENVEIAVSEPARAPIRPETSEERLYRIAYQLSLASAGRCSQPEMLTGLSLHDISAYAEKERPALERQFDMTFGFGVRMVVPGSVSAKAGLLPGDTIIQVNGEDLNTFRTGLIRRQADYARTAEFETLLDHTLRNGPAQLLVRRAGATVTVSMEAVDGCGGKPVFYERGGLNAWADGTYVAVTEKMIDFARTDDELAFVVAHEMGHNILKHGNKLRGRSMLLASLGLGSGKVKNTEIEADALGAQILAEAGYSIDGALSVLDRSRSKQAFTLSFTHPGINRRMAVVKSAVEGTKLAENTRGNINGVDQARSNIVVLATFEKALMPSVLGHFQNAKAADSIGLEPGDNEVRLMLAPWWQLQTAEILMAGLDEALSKKAVALSHNLIAPEPVEASGQTT